MDWDEKVAAMLAVPNAKYKHLDFVEGENEPYRYAWVDVPCAMRDLPELVAFAKSIGCRSMRVWLGECTTSGAEAEVGIAIKRPLTGEEIALASVTQ